MAQPLRFSQTKSPKNRKGGSVYTLELQMPEWMVQSFCSPKWVENMREKHSKKIKFALKQPKSEECGEKGCGEKGCGEKGCGEKEDNMWTFVVTGKQKLSIKNLGSDAIDRYNKMIYVFKNLVKD